MLADRGFDAGDFLAEVADTSAQFLIRLRSNRRLLVVARCDDGSFLSRIGTMTVRIITVDITVTAPTAAATPPPIGWRPPCSITGSGLQRGVRLAGQPRVEAGLQVGSAHTPEQAERLGDLPVLRPVQRVPAGPVGVR
jgi:hypothetical protein